ncbi:serine/threonine protein kinase [Leptolyngbya cf. ectocarpi LEGE 11479]|uniref:non-specific serine/threonine protein kinase n=1 Tax=Leptolyngbya cf. ectocarpi LEGE 11479 TaxID=1828722 RepID=A0A928ZT67_LEPEC|nr:serine/threonine-protein kinase [Leptolyngbya ectocarpi]MBE9066536.1 serine/threonine protein kinase [Leptolyngbya cf. ectocarpi LEGE 11479]
MSYCINPRCGHRDNPDGLSHCKSCGTPLLVAGRYRLIRPLRDLDEWEPSEVFEIDDQGQTKVLKVLKKKILEPLFEREAATLQTLNHPGIPQVEPDGYFSLEIEGRPLHCLVMENIQGINLENWLQQHGPIDQAQAMDWMKQLVDLLALLHQEELFHRDIKLANIMLRPTGNLALVDFGTVRPMTSTYFAKVAGQRDITSVVSPGYTPLEQINGRAVPQSDFYALGRSLVYLLTGAHPIDLPEDDNTGRLTWRDRTSVDNWFAQLLDDMMAPFPGQRPLNAEVLLERLANPVAPQIGVRSNGEISEVSEQREEQTIARWLMAANVGMLLLHLLVGWQWYKAHQRLAEQSVIPPDPRVSTVFQSQLEPNP